MNPDISQAEVDALLGSEGAGAEAVTPRDFARPRRLSSRQLDSLGKQLSSCLPKIERELAARGCGGFRLSLFHVEETTETAFLSSLEERGFFVQSLNIGDAAGWIQWEPKGARSAVEESLGCSATPDPDASLSELERSLAGDLVMTIASGVAAELDLPLSQGEDFVEQRLLQAVVDGAPSGDEQRLSVALELASARGRSKLYLYLPGVTPTEDPAHQESQPTALPGHLDDVEVSVRAELQSIELPLEGVLALEEGDVITLGSGSDTTARLVVDDRAAGSATWAREGDRLTLSVLDLSIRSTD